MIPVTRARLRQMSTIKISAFMTAYCVTYATLFIVEKNHFDPGKLWHGKAIRKFLGKKLMI